MLLQLKVKNYALIADVDMKFDSGLNIITGETGAGKSILIGALGLSLGKRADTSVLRSADGKCVIEAHFDVSRSNLETFFKEHDLDYEPITIFRREITSSGKSRSFINDTPVQLKTMDLLGSQLIEIHSQHDNLQLFKTAFQFDALDQLAHCSNDRLAFTLRYRNFLDLMKVVDDLKDKQAELRREQDYNQFLFDELQQADLDHVDEDELTREQEMLDHAEELIKGFNDADQLFNGSELSVIGLLQELKHILTRQHTSMTDDMTTRIASVIVELQDIASDISRAADRVEVNPERLEQVNDQLGLIFTLRSKHQCSSVAELIEIRDRLDQKLNLSLSMDQEIADKEDELDQLRNELEERAQELKDKRLKDLDSIHQKMNDRLAQLGMQHSRFQFELSDSDDFNSFGKQGLQLLLSSDKGVTFNDLRKSASGGELGRINLSFKHLVGNSGERALATSVFDEIDTGVSGEIARKVGAMMDQMGDGQQVIVITHLPQIASLGSNHLYVYKDDSEGQVETRVRALLGDERINEIAKMISGDNLTEHALEQSKALLKQ